MGITENAAYIKGLFDGYEIDKASKEGKIIDAIVDILDDMADELELIYDDIDSLYEYADELDADLGEVESEIFEIEDDDDYYDECFDCDAESCEGCSACGEEE